MLIYLNPKLNFHCDNMCFMYQAAISIFLQIMYVRINILLAKLIREV